MPNIICEELVMKNGKVDIVEQEASKFWNEKIQRLEEEIKKQQERAEKFRVRNCDRQEELVKALSPWKKNHEDHKRILEAIGELQEENKELKQERDNLREEVAQLNKLKELHQ